MRIVHEARMDHGLREAMQRFAPMASLTCAAAAFFALTSPFGAVTYLPLLARFGYWGGLIALALACACASDAAWKRIEWTPSPLWRPLTRSSAAALPVWAAILVVQGALARPVPSHFVVELLGCVAIICLVLFAVAELVDAVRRAPGLSQDDAEAASHAGVRHERHGLAPHLPARLRAARIIGLSAEDHYVRVHTDRGAHLVLMRLADAIAAMPPGAGVRTHRSWWVATEAVTRVVRENRGARIELAAGIVARASRTGLGALKLALGKSL